MKTKNKKNTKSLNFSEKKDDCTIKHALSNNFIFIFEEDRKLLEEMAKNNRYIGSMLNYGTK